MDKFEQANKEVQDLFKWAEAEEDKIYEENKGSGGLGANRKLYQALHIEFYKRVQAVRKKYGIPEPEERQK